MDVSIIIPTYNRLWCLPRAIESCRHTRCQTQIVVVDDGSTDGTAAWLQQQPGLTVLHQANQGQTYAINHGVAQARGRYIRFLDSDDFLAPGTIDAQFEAAENSGAHLVYGRVDGYEEATGAIVQQPDLPLWDDFLEVQLSNRYGSHFLGMLFHRSLVEQVPRRPDFAFREDRMFLLETGLLKPRLALTPGCAGYWVRHPQQMQGNYRGLKSQVTNWQHLQIYRRILQQLEERGELTAPRRRAACTVLWPLAHWIAKDHLAEAKEVYAWIRQLDPAFRPPEKGWLQLAYTRLGFGATERLLQVRRLLKYGWT